MPRCTVCLTRQHGRLIAGDVPVYCLNPRLIAVNTPVYCLNPRLNAGDALVHCLNPRLVVGDAPVHCLNPRLIAGDHDLSEVKQMRSEDGNLCAVSFSGIMLLCETVTSAVAVLL